MLVVPIEKDVITTTDGAKYKVTEYTNYKEAGPAVYARSCRCFGCQRNRRDRVSLYPLNWEYND